ncbi:MAG TPA: UDP-N-acetylmuramoyl-L-alanine--D-glutamate ligase [Bacilli bacterium]|nr:UDP-N-acetylmuramoyl-L-alanine--D-glutamate ligase [Bacilli bacterium]
MYKNKKIFILGMARSGYEVAKLLSDYNNEILITDMKEQDPKQVAELKSKNVKYIITDNPEELLDDSYDVLIKNPGIIKTHKCVVKAKELNMEVINELEVAYAFLNKNSSIIGITGSNGKTTTTTLIYNILKEAKLDVILGGNIGYPVSSIVKDVRDNTILVLEISDHQLLDMYNFKTNISVLTNLFHNHLDFHGSYENYINAKKKIFNNHTKDDIAIINMDNDDCMELTKDIISNKEYFSKNKKCNCYIENNDIYYENEKIISIDDIKIKGMHNYENIMCAIMVVKKYNVSNEVIKKILNTFNGVEHRIEFVKTLNNVDYYNDSKSTNTDSTIIAVKSFNKPTILIMGGLDRGHSFEPLNDYMSNVKLVVCYGETKERIKFWCDSINKECIVLNDLKEATLRSIAEAKKGDIVLLSPACASWDQYKCFEDRGNEFKSYIK